MKDDLADFWGRSVKVTFYKNGKAKFIEESDGGGAISIGFDENGNNNGGYLVVDINAFSCLRILRILRMKISIKNV